MNYLRNEKQSHTLLNYLESNKNSVISARDLTYIHQVLKLFCRVL